MKRILIVLLSLVMAIALSSCSQDKSSEVAGTYEKFTTGLAICKGAADACLKKMGSKESTVTLTAGDIKQSSLKASIEGREGYPSGIIKSPTVTSASGTVSGTASEARFENVEIKSSYTLNSDYGAVSPGTVLYDTLTLSGSYSYKENSADNSINIDCSMTVNKEEYNLSCTIEIDSFENRVFKAAKINGSDVSLKLLNAANVNLQGK